MKPLFLIRTALRLETLSRWSAERGLVRRGRIERGFDEGRALHHLLDEMFGPSAIKPFRLLVPSGGHTANLYGYSELCAEELREAAVTFGLPEHIKVIQPTEVESKRMPSEWKQGQRLGFDLRIRPVRRLGASLKNGDSNFHKGAELDAFLLEALRSTRKAARECQIVQGPERPCISTGLRGGSTRRRKSIMTLRIW